MGRRVLLMAVVAVSLVIMAADVSGQQGAVYISCVRPLFHADTIQTGSDILFQIAFTNNTGERCNVSNGFKISTPDGAVWDSVTIDTIGPNSNGANWFASYFDVAFSSEYQLKDLTPSYSDTVGLLGAGTMSGNLRQLPFPFDQPVYHVTVYMNTSGPVNSGKHICIDSSFFQPAGTWKWVGRSVTDYRPEFRGLGSQAYLPGSGYCFFLYDVCYNSQDSYAKAACLRAASSSCSCCTGSIRGNVDMTGIVDLGDLSAIISYLTEGGYQPPCFDAANANGVGIIDLSDLSALVSYLSGGGYVMTMCP